MFLYTSHHRFIRIHETRETQLVLNHALQKQDLRDFQMWLENRNQTAMVISFILHLTHLRQGIMKCYQDAVTHDSLLYA